MSEALGPWECFQDAAYYDMWCVRRVHDREFGNGFHLVNGEEASALRDLLNTRTSERDWQGIESAPRDGTPLLLFARRIGATASARVVGWYLQERGWVELSFTGPVGIEPTAWQPLPAPPRGDHRKD